MRATARRVRRQRGAALVVAVVAVLVITVIGISMIDISTRELGGATAGARRESVVACAEAARQVLMSRFSALGISPTELTALNVPLDASSGGNLVAVGGHLGDSPVTPSVIDPSKTEVQIDQVTQLPDNAFGKTRSVRDITNVVALTGQGGKPMKVVVHCIDHGDGTPTGGRQLEVEFGVRFGL